MLAKIRSWSDHPELSELYKKLDSVTDGQQFLDHYAEAMIAIHFLAKECSLRYEVPTVNKKTADFRVNYKGVDLFIHVKRLNLDSKTQRNINIASRLDKYKKKGYNFFLYDIMSDHEMQYFVREVDKFSKTAETGESITILSSDGKELGECEKLALNMASIQHPVTEDCDSIRYNGILKKAYKQFQLDAINIIMIGGFWNDRSDLEEGIRNYLWYGSNNSRSNIIVRYVYDIKETSIAFRIYYRNKKYNNPVITELFTITRTK